MFNTGATATEGCHAIQIPPPSVRQRRHADHRPADPGADHDDRHHGHHSSNTQYKLAGNLQFEAMRSTGQAAVAAAEQWLSTGTNYSNAGFAAFGGGYRS
jgi:hypothetical protein